MGRSAIFRLFPVSKASLLSIVSLREDQWRKIGKLPYKKEHNFITLFKRFLKC